MGGQQSVPLYSGPKQRVVVVGGGLAAHLLLQALEAPKGGQPNLELVMVTNTDYMPYPPATVRAVVNPDFACLTAFPNALLKTKARVVFGKAVNVTENKVECVTAEGRVNVEYDYLVIATGAGYREKFISTMKPSSAEDFPETYAQRIQRMKETAETVRRARSITVVGAGATGLEVAGEIAHHLPDTHVRLITRDSEVGDWLIPKLKTQVQEVLKGFRNLEVHTNTSYDERHHHAEVVFMATGLSPNTEWLKASALKGSLTPTGHLKCEQGRTFRVQGGPHNRIFAIGDVCSPGHLDIENAYSLAALRQQAPHIAANMVRAIRGEEIREVKVGQRACLLTFGPNKAVGSVGNRTLPQFAARMFKANDFYTSDMQKHMATSTWKPGMVYDRQAKKFHK